MSLTPELKRRALEVADIYNDVQSDAVLFIAKHLVATSDAVDAEVTDISETTMTFLVRSADDTRRVVEYPLATPVTEVEHVAGHLIAMLQEARDSVGERESLTRIERQLARSRELDTYITRVKATQDITPDIREITFTGGLANFVAPGWDAFVFVMLPPNGASFEDGFTMAQWRSFPVDERPAGAYYTIRRAKPGEVVCWFVLHGDDGPLSHWAGQAQPGDEVALWGPRLSFEPHADTQRYLLFADETALPAVASILETLPYEADVTAIIECQNDSGIIELREEDHWRIDWRFRGKNRPGQSDVMMRALADIDLANGQKTYVFGAAEATQMATIRKTLKAADCFEKGQVHLIGYWRRDGGVA